VPAGKDPLDGCTGFQWDQGNETKNWDLHQVTQEEAEAIFFHDPLIVRSDVAHSSREKRYYALGQTAQGRRLFATFTIRRHLVRIISVRDMNRNESKIYKEREAEGDS
jgi:uncharacterized protein